MSRLEDRIKEIPLRLFEDVQQEYDRLTQGIIGATGFKRRLFQQPSHIVEEYIAGAEAFISNCFIDEIRNPYYAFKSEVIKYLRFTQKTSPRLLRSYQRSLHREFARLGTVEENKLNGRYYEEGNVGGTIDIISFTYERRDQSSLWNKIINNPNQQLVSYHTHFVKFIRGMTTIIDTLDQLAEQDHLNTAEYTRLSNIGKNIVSKFRDGIKTYMPQQYIDGGTQG